MTKLMCACCGEPHRFIDEDTPVGSRPFCSEKCWAEYNGMEIKPEGYYGFIQNFRGA